MHLPERRAAARAGGGRPRRRGGRSPADARGQELDQALRRPGGGGRCEPHRPSGGDPRHHRTERRRQVDALQSHHRPLQGGFGPGRPRGRGHHGPARVAARQARHGPLVPADEPLLDDAREHERDSGRLRRRRHDAAACSERIRRRFASAARSCSSESASGSSASFRRTSSRTATSARSRSRLRSPSTLAYSCWTSPPPVWPRARRRRRSS